ncbi:uncharacterized protein LOC111019676 [Momordica charantia]|uniref:Uncharacterized protein LOC111019676 n=1 Tax=Momordica charantia TaxID=3673 RepID=A0A6J1DED8_MOMCH|nr:uncharacterized protein LOC111019676 [Momordica charantia]
MGAKNLVCLSLVLVAVAVAQAHAADICAKADYAALCRSMVKGAGNNPVAATRAGIEKLILATKIAREARLKSAKSGALGVCKETFANAISELKMGLDYLQKKDKDSLNIELSGAMTDYTTCDDAIAESGVVGKAVGIVKIDRTLLNMASNCLYLSTLT